MCGPRDDRGDAHVAREARRRRGRRYGDAGLAAAAAAAADDLPLPPPPLPTPAMADVERRAGGRRPVPTPVPLLSAADESWRSRDWASPADSSSPPLACGERAEPGFDGGPGVLLAGGATMEMCDDEAAVDDECERCLMVRSDGLRRRSWLLVARWPGVWLRGSGGALSWPSFLSSSSGGGGRESAGGLESVGLRSVARRESGGRASAVGDTAWIFCDRTTLVLSDGRALSADLLPWSAIASWHAHEAGNGGETRAMDTAARGLGREAG